MSNHPSPLLIGGQLPPYTIESTHSTPHGVSTGSIADYVDNSAFDMKTEARDLQSMAVPSHLALPMLSMPQIPTQAHVQPLPPPPLQQQQQQQLHQLPQQIIQQQQQQAAQMQVPVPTQVEQQASVQVQQEQKPMQHAQQEQPPLASSSKAKNGHTGPADGKAKPHLCTACKRSFTTGGHLQRHQRIHTGIKAFKCPFPGCETRTSRQDNLQQHYRTHLSPSMRRGSGSEAKAAVNAAMAAAGLRSHAGRATRKSKHSTPSSASSSHLPTPYATPNPVYPFMYDPGHYPAYPGMPSSNTSSRVPSPANAMPMPFYPQYNPYAFPMQQFRPMPGYPGAFFPGMMAPGPESQGMYLPPNFQAPGAPMPFGPAYPMPTNDRDFRRISSPRARRTPPPPQPHEYASRGVDPNMMHRQMPMYNFNTPPPVSGAHMGHGNASIGSTSNSVSVVSGMANHRHSLSAGSDDSALGRSVDDAGSAVGSGMDVVGNGNGNGNGMLKRTSSAMLNELD